LPLALASRRVIRLRTSAEVERFLADADTAAEGSEAR